MRERISRINSICRPITNCYSLEVADKAEKMWEDGDSFIFFYEDHGTKRLVYFAENEEILSRLLTLPKGGCFYLEFMTKDENQWYEMLKNKGYCQRAKMLRFVNSDCISVLQDGELHKYRNDGIGTQAQESDAHEINEILWKLFHTEVSHLLNDEELRSLVDRITIHKNKEGKIDAILQADVMPKKFYINQVVNLTDRSIIHAILQQRLWDYVHNGGKYMYAWVEDTNIASKKFHEKYGMRHDGMYSLIYQRENE